MAVMSLRRVLSLRTNFHNGVFIEWVMFEIIFTASRQAFAHAIGSQGSYLLESKHKVRCHNAC